MQEFILDDVRCPSLVADIPCRGIMALEEGLINVVRASDDSNEITEGVLRCQKCHATYPIVCGLAIMVAEPWAYFRIKYKTITSLTTELGYPISQAMIDLFQRYNADLATEKQEDKYETALVLNEYLSIHYDNVWSILPPNHPVKSIIRGIYQHGFYETNSLKVAPYLNSKQKALDIGCGVGRNTYELARHCGKVYGIEISYNSALVARQILRHFPSRLTEYWLKMNGDNIHRRQIADWRQKNVEIIVASGEGLPFETESIDVVNNWNVIDRLSNPGKMLEENVRVLKPGGIFSYSDPYSWKTEYTPREQWIGGRDEKYSVDAIRERIQETLDIFYEDLYEPWLFWEHERQYTLCINHFLIACKH